MNIYTKTGDNGTTSTPDGKRVSKAGDIISAYGDIDELTAHLGLLRTMIADTGDALFIEQLQHLLLAIGTSIIGGDVPAASFATATAEMETLIDRISRQLPTLHNFVIPGNSVAEAQCHVCRTVCRRAERSLVAVRNCRENCPEILSFINRMSDYLFVLARNLNFITHQTEKTWHNTCR